MPRNCLIIFAKGPDRASVKTRLAVDLTADQRLRLYTSLVTDTISKLRNISGVHTCISYTPPEAWDYFRRFGLSGFAQSGGDIGMRMYNALKKVLGDGYEKAVLVGVDIPDITSSIVLRAFELLADHDVVFGPARDGGYYLIGLKEAFSHIFRDIEWSSSHTLNQSIKKALANDCRLGFTEMLSDVDRIEDVRQWNLSKLKQGPP